MVTKTCLTVISIHVHIKYLKYSLVKEEIVSSAKLTMFSEYSSFIWIKIVNLLNKYIYSISLKVIFHQISFTMDVPLIGTDDKYEDSFLSVQSKYIVFTQYTHKKNKNLPNCDQYMFVRRIAKWTYYLLSIKTNRCLSKKKTNFHLLPTFITRTALKQGFKLPVYNR